MTIMASATASKKLTSRVRWASDQPGDGEGEKQGENDHAAGRRSRPPQ
jgi:hypothetical protein